MKSSGCCRLQGNVSTLLALSTLCLSAIVASAMRNGRTERNSISALRLSGRSTAFDLQVPLVGIALEVLAARMVVPFEGLLLLIWPLRVIIQG